ncbi:hypothetical protein ACVW00_003744 [Marmoricola sp. URHA0025 HA25]
MQAPLNLQPTFVITRDGDVDLYKTLDDAASYMEAIDVRDGEYEDAFSMTGERLEIVIDGYQVRLVSTGVKDLPRLRDRLRQLADRNGYSEADDPDPRAVANEVFANEWRARWPRWPRWLDRRLHGDGPLRV